MVFLMQQEVTLKTVIDFLMQNLCLGKFVQDSFLWRRYAIVVQADEVVRPEKSRWKPLDPPIKGNIVIYVPQTQKNIFFNTFRKANKALEHFIFILTKANFIIVDR